MVFGQQVFHRIESNSWTTYGIRVEDFPGESSILIQRIMGEFQCEPENFTGRIIFMSTFNDIVWGERKHRIVYCEFPQCSRICMKIRARSLVVSEPRASGKPDALFSSRSDEAGNQFESSMFKNADPSKLGRSLLEGSKDHLLSQARSELLKQGHQVGISQ